MKPGKPKLEVKKDRSLPFVFVNVAITADGKIATANRVVMSPGSARDLRHLMELRATADAVMSGATTVNSGKVTLGPGAAKFRRLRLRRGLAEYNLRVILSGSASLNPAAEVFRRRHSPVIVLTTRRAPKTRIERLRSAGAEVKSFGNREIDFRSALKWLREKWNVKCLLCEGGGEVNDALFRAGLVDEVHVTICPKIFGGRDAPTLAGGHGFAKLADAAKFEVKSTRRIEDELFVVLSRASAKTKSSR